MLDLNPGLMCMATELLGHNQWWCFKCITPVFNVMWNQLAVYHLGERVRFDKREQSFPCSVSRDLWSFDKMINCSQFYQFWELSHSFKKCILSLSLENL